MELHRIKKLLILTETTTYVIPWCIAFVTISTRIFHVSIQILAYFHNLKLCNSVPLIDDSTINLQTFLAMTIVIYLM